MGHWGAYCYIINIGGGYLSTRDRNQRQTTRWHGAIDVQYEAEVALRKDWQVGLHYWVLNSLTLVAERACVGQESTRTVANWTNLHGYREHQPMAW